MSKREDILQATLRMVARQGMHDTPMTHIAKEAGVGMGTIYNYFPSKEALITELYLQVKKDEADYMVQNAAPRQSVRQAFLHFWKNILHFFIVNPQAFTFVEQVYFLPLIKDEDKKKGAMYFADLLRVYEEGQRQEIIKEGDITQLIYFTHGALASLAKFHILGDISLDEDAMQRAVEAAWDAIKR